MLRYSNVSKRMFAFAARIRSLSLTTFAHEGRLWGGTWVSGNKNLRRIFIFIFYWILIYHIKAGGREGEIHFFSLYYIKSREREGRYISTKFF